MFYNLIGDNYNETGNDILLLDISNNDGYIWTNSFEPQTTPTTSLATTTTTSIAIPPLSTSVSSSPLSSQQSNALSKNIPVVIGIAIGAFIVSISLAFEGVFLYQRNKNKKENKKAISFPGNEVKDTNHEILEIPAIRNLNNYRHEIISTTPAIGDVYRQKMLPKIAENENLTNNEIYNGNEITPSTDNQGSSLQNIEEMLHVITQEVQDLKARVNTK